MNMSASRLPTMRSRFEPLSAHSSNSLTGDYIGFFFRPFTAYDDNLIRFACLSISSSQQLSAAESIFAKGAAVRKILILVFHASWFFGAVCIALLAATWDVRSQPADTDKKSDTVYHDLSLLV